MSAEVITLERVEAFAPRTSAAIEEVAGALGLNQFQARMFRRFHGMDMLRLDPGLDTFGLLLGAGKALLRWVPDPSLIRYVILAHTVIEITPGHLDAAAVLARRLGLTAAEPFALTQQNCASGLAAIDAAGELLWADGDPCAKALVLTGEKPFTPLVQLIANTTVMGEASAACLVGVDDTKDRRPSGTIGVDRVRSYAAWTLGRFSDGIRLSAGALKDFNDTYTANLVAVIKEAVARAGLTLADITMIIPHNVNRRLWLRTADELGLDRHGVYLDNIPRYSHTYCSDPLLNLVTLRDEGLLLDGGRYVLTAVGLGATYAAMVIEHEEPR